MTSWMKERDRLVEQTLAFVQGVAAQRRPVGTAAADVALTTTVSAVATASPDVVSPPPDPALPVFASQAAEIDSASAETDALISLMALSQPSHPGDSAVPAPIMNARPQTQSQTGVKAAPATAAKRRIEMAMPERDIIAQRVARFRAGQQKLIQQRDDNYTEVQARIRATLGNDSPA